MKNILKYAALLLLAGFTLTGCETENMPERKVVQHPDQQTPILRDDAYYARLRAYKKTEHKVAFGWFGSWNPENASRMATLNHAPDSMDIISIWSQWHSLTPSQMADKEFVQKVKGTKVTFTIFTDNMPEPFASMFEDSYSDEAIEAYAKAYCKDSIDKYAYDGIDIDYEPGFGASGDFVGHNNENFKRLILAMSKYVGPRSGTDRLFIIDGVPYAVHTEIADCFDYGIVQAYYSSGYWDLQSRFDEAWKKGWKPEQYIFAEDFEKGWQKGGVTHQLRNGEYVPSLYGMALFDPDQGTGAGFGAYHMEYEYGHNDMVYKFMRQAIQLVNPAPAGDLTKTLISINEAADMETFQIDQTPSGHVYGEVTTEITGKISALATADTDIKLTVDNDFVKAYNTQNDTEYKTLDPSLVVFSGALHFPAGKQMTETPVSISVPGINTVENGDYMIVVKPDVAASKEFGTNEKAAQKILIVNKKATHIKVSVTGANSSSFAVMQLLDGSQAGEVKTSFGVTLSREAIEELSFGYVMDNDLVKTYNAEHSTEYQTLPVSAVTVTGKLSIARNSNTSSNTVAVEVTALDQLQMGNTLIALRPDLSKLTDYTADENAGIKYLFVGKSAQNVQPAQNLEDYEANSTLIDNTNNALGWEVGIVNRGPVGGNGVWNFDSNQMFDGNLGDKAPNGWYAFFGNQWSWRRGQPDGEVTIDMKNVNTVGTVLWSICYANTLYALKTIAIIETSLDGKVWTRQNHGDVSLAKGENSLQWFSFINPVETRYIRITISDGYGDYCGMAEIRIYAPKN